MGRFRSESIKPTGEDPEGDYFPENSTYKGKPGSSVRSARLLYRMPYPATHAMGVRWVTIFPCLVRVFNLARNQVTGSPSEDFSFPAD